MTQHIVPAAAIETELSRIWESMEATNKMRACLFNLIIYTHKNPRSAYLKKVALRVVEKFPSRIIFISADTSPDKSYLQTSVSVITTGKGEVDIACDMIDIEVGGAQQERIPFVILPHIVPDLPVYLVWGEDPLKENPLTYQLDHFTTRIIFDSESASSLRQFAESVLYHKNHSECDVADLNWARLENWREALSSNFYTPERLDDLKEINSLNISYNAQGTEFFCHTPIQAIYLQGWLATRLGWELKKSKKEQDVFSLTYQRNSQEICVKLSPVYHTHLAPGSLCSFELSTTKGKHFSFTRDLEMPHQIKMIFSTLEICSIPFRFIFGKGEIGQSLVKEICHKGTSIHYLKLLELIAKTPEIC